MLYKEIISKIKTQFESLWMEKIEPVFNKQKKADSSNRMAS